MKILGIDYGEKRIGLAISDESRTLARELTILSPKEFWGQLGQLVSNQQIGTIVIGLPLGVEGNDTEKTKEVRLFSNQIIEKTNLPVEFIDERFSSAMAKNLPGGKKDVDSLAAQIFLQNYLDKNKK